MHRFAGMYIPPFDLVETRPLNDAMEGRADADCGIPKMVVAAVREAAADWISILRRLVIIVDDISIGVGDFPPCSAYSFIYSTWRRV